MLRHQMRFAYIDSQGKEVGIPTVEALQLRIELGAIVASTMFFDASSERWSPAGEHEIFRSLQRELSDRGDLGFEASPPVLGHPTPGSEGEPPALITDSFEAPAAEPGEPDSLPPADPTPTPPAARKTKADPFEPGTFTLAPLDDSYAPPSSDERATPATGDRLLEGLERTSLPAAPRSGADSSAPPRGPAEEPEVALDVGPLAPRPAVPSSELGLESPLSQQLGADGPSSWKGGLDLDPRAPDLRVDGPPGWDDEEAGSAVPGAPPTRPGGGARAGSAKPAPRAREAPARTPLVETHADTPRREPRSRPLSPSRAAPKRGRGGAMIAGAAVVAVALLGGAGWFGWSWLRGRDGATQSAYEPVEIPALPAQLEGVFGELAPAAAADAVEALAARLQAAGLAAEPPVDWLAGQYLANASRYPDVAAYWQGIANALVELRGEELGLFRASFEARMADVSLTPDERTALVERADAGFRSALPDRDRIYERLAAVAAAALELHGFLLENEDRIDYDPAAAGISRDPVLEAVPASRQLGDEMWQRVDRITSALEAMNALTERVTTQRLFSLTFERVAATSVP